MTKRGDTSGSATKPQAKLPDVLDVKDLDGDERAILLAVLSEQFDPCGKPRSFLDSLHDKSPCDRAVKLGKQAVVMVTQGLSKKQIVRRLHKELARTSKQHKFKLESSPYLGDASSKKVLVEFTDFECPACRMASDLIKELAQKHGAVLYIKNIPLSYHPKARPAAIASLAADRQGKYWELYGLLFKNQRRLSDAVIRELAESVGLDMERFDADIKSPEIGALLDRDIKEADRARIPGTPTVFLNGFMVELPELEQKLQALD